MSGTVISHGTGGSPFLYRTLAAHLARGGFVVAMPEHPRNNHNNNDLAGTAAILANRSWHIRIVIDWMFASDDFAPSPRPNTVAVIGHSLGGYTVLAVAGGRPKPRGCCRERVCSFPVLAPCTGPGAGRIDFPVGVTPKVFLLE
ncbi:MAG: alpha/beta hydrolase family protein [Pseudonocardiaceae bacterium]